RCWGYLIRVETWHGRPARGKWDLTYDLTCVAETAANSAPAGRKELSRSVAGGERSEPPDRHLRWSDSIPKQAGEGRRGACRSEAEQGSQSQHPGAGGQNSGNTRLLR